MGSGIALLVWSRLGMVPMDVLHAAVSHAFGWTFGSSILVCQFILATTFLPLRIRPGIGTPVALVIPAAVADALLSLMPTADYLPLPEALGLVIRTLALLLGGLLFCGGVAAYLTAALGQLPRDALMLALAGARDITQAEPRRLALARISIDTTCLAGGIALLGPDNAMHLGALAPGTLLIAVGSGPLISYLRRLAARVLGFSPQATPATVRHETGRHRRTRPAHARTGRR
ncbi:hypothetical protein M8542_36105 [Amycolatopsis sp. OK19-0408]|uniref:Membrane protein YczE n=1 Tax=Amycolatopsis iheyensis TaxID=2945988 RepID=A0A9X2NJ33_9PSEU|nr:hypothetical protein [Amycolatopsis iheyensis]MCR6488268.1 hypothetical protein [Amycolatopsis iheyensis]